MKNQQSWRKKLLNLQWENQLAIWVLNLVRIIAQIIYLIIAQNWLIFRSIDDRMCFTFPSDSKLFYALLGLIY